MFLLVALMPVLFSAAPQASLEVQADPPAAACLSKAQLEREVAERLGYNPFDARADRHITVSVHARGVALDAKLELSMDANPIGEQTLSSDTGDCRELASALVVAMSVVLDPLNSSVPNRTTVVPRDEDEQEASEPPAEANGVREVGRPAAAPFEVDANLGVTGAVDAAPTANLGFTLGAALRWPRFSLGLEGQGGLPAGFNDAAVNVQTFVLAAALLPCLRYRAFGVCAEVALGMQEAQASGAAASDQKTSLFADAGGRLLWERRVYGPFGIGAHVDVVAPLVHTNVMLNGSPAWSTPAVAVSGGLQASLQLR